MNKNDIRLVLILCIIILGLFIFIKVGSSSGDRAEVYYKDRMVLSIDLSIDKEYVVDGELGDVVIEVRDRKVRVKSENSPRNICSKEGFIEDSSRALICLPNKIVIKIVGKTQLDGVVY